MTLPAPTLPWLNPLRRAVARLPRGAMMRSAAVLALKQARPHYQLHRLLQTIEPLDMPGVRFHATDSMVMDDVYWFGLQGYEGRMADVWVSLCQQAPSVLEVGGNIGVFTVIGARQRPSGARYTVVEPVPGNVAVLQANLALNGIEGVEVLQAAAVAQAEPATVMLNVPREGRQAPVGAQLVAGGEVTGRSTETLLPVQGLPFVDLLQGRQLVKIDAEGIEVDLLASALDDLQRHRPTLVIEVLPEAVRLAGLLRDLALSAGYGIYVVPAYGSDTIVQVPAEQFDAGVPGRHQSKDVVLSLQRVQ